MAEVGEMFGHQRAAPAFVASDGGHQRVEERPAGDHGGDHPPGRVDCGRIPAASRQDDHGVNPTGQHVVDEFGEHPGVVFGLGHDGDEPRNPDPGSRFRG